MTIQNGDVGPPKLRKSLQCAMIWVPGDVKKKTHPVWYWMPVWLLQSSVTNPILGV